MLVKIYIYISDCKISLSNSSFVLLFPSSPGLLYQNEVKCSAFDTEMIFHSHANKTNFRKKGCVLGLILKARVLKLGSIFTSPCGDATAIYVKYPSEPRKGPAVCRAKEAPSFFSYFKTLSIGPVPGIEPATSRSAVERATD